jgi:hypothetical protein
MVTLALLERFYLEYLLFHNFTLEVVKAKVQLSH